LLATLVAYRNWRSELSPEERLGLAQLEPAERVAKIRAIQTEQEKRALARAAKELNPDDARVIRHWLDAYAKDHAAELKQRFSNREQEQFEGAKDAKAQDYFLRGRVFRDILETRRFPTTDPDQIKRLVESLSKEAQAKWATATTDELRNTLLVEWVGHAMMLGWRGPGRHRPPGPTDPDEVRQFIKNLPDEERAKLNGMRYEEQLRYFFEKGRHGKGGPPWGGPKRREGGPPGDRERFDKKRPERPKAGEPGKPVI
jgi:hypothetical protein